MRGRNTNSCSLYRFMWCRISTVTGIHTYTYIRTGIRRYEYMYRYRYCTRYAACTSTKRTTGGGPSGSSRTPTSKLRPSHTTGRRSWSAPSLRRGGCSTPLRHLDFLFRRRAPFLNRCGRGAGRGRRPARRRQEHVL